MDIHRLEAQQENKEKEKNIIEETYNTPEGVACNKKHHAHIKDFLKESFFHLHHECAPATSFSKYSLS